MPKLISGGSHSKDIHELFNLIIFEYIDSRLVKTKDFSPSVEERLISLIDRLPAILVANIAFYFKTRIGPNNVISLIAVLLAEKLKSSRWGRYWYFAIVDNPQEIIDIIRMLFRRNKKLPIAMRNGFLRAFTTFGEKDLAAYQNIDQEVSLLDVINLIHPKHTEAIGKLIGKRLKPIVPEEPVVSYLILKDLSLRINNNFAEVLKEIEYIEFKF